MTNKTDETNETDVTNKTNETAVINKTDKTNETDMTKKIDETDKDLTLHFLLTLTNAVRREMEVGRSASVVGRWSAAVVGRRSLGDGHWRQFSLEYLLHRRAQRPNQLDRSESETWSIVTCI